MYSSDHGREASINFQAQNHSRNLAGKIYFNTVTRSVSKQHDQSQISLQPSTLLCTYGRKLSLYRHTRPHFRSGQLRQLHRLVHFVTCKNRRTRAHAPAKGSKKKAVGDPGIHFLVGPDAMGIDQVPMTDRLAAEHGSYLNFGPSRYSSCPLNLAHQSKPCLTSPFPPSHCFFRNLAS